MIQNTTYGWTGGSWRDAVVDYHRRTYIALDPDLESTITALQEAGYEEVVEGELSQVERFALARMDALERIEFGFVNAFKHGKFVTQTLYGFEVDCRRGGERGTDNDIDNITRMISLINKGIIQTPVPWVGVSETRLCTLADLESILTEMEVYGVQVYQRKHSLEAQVNAIADETPESITFLNQIEWEQ